MFAFALVIYSVRTKNEICFIDVERVQNLSNRTVNFKNLRSPWRATLHDMTRPLFLLSFFLMLLFIWQIEGPTSEKIWLALRPLATAYLLFYLVRCPFIAKKLFNYSQRSASFNKIYQKSKKAFELISTKKP